MDSIIRKNISTNKKRQYFTKETEKAIVAYNTTTNSKEKSLIYENHIHYPFFKLTQNIIHTFKFYNTEVENLEDLQHEIMVFLLDKIHLFNPDKGTKAYSYFGTIVKNWLILYNKKNYTKKINHLSMNDLKIYSEVDVSDPLFIRSSALDKELKKLETNINEDINDELEFQGYKVRDKLSYFIDHYIEHCTENIYDYFPKEYDAKIADAILELFRKRENIDVFNKKALYIYIREMIDVKTPKITKIADRLHGIFKKNYLIFTETGEIPF